MSDFRRPLKGNFMRWKGAAWRVLQCRKSVLVIEVVATGETERMTLQAWQQGCYDGSIEMIRNPAEELPELLRDLAATSFAALSPTMRRAVERKKVYIDAFRDPAAFYAGRRPDVAVGSRYMPTRLGRKKVVPFLEQVAASFDGSETAPSFSAFHGWMKRWEKYQDWRMMAPRYDRKGPNARSVIVGPLAGIMDAAIKEWAVKAQEPIADLISNVDSRILVWNSENPDERPLKVCRRQIYRYVDDEVDKYDLAVAREGKAAADRKFSPIWEGPEAKHVMDLVEVDHTQAKTEVCDDETGKSLGRPWVTAALDSHSRLPVGLHVHFEGQTTHAAMQALKNAMLPKHYLRKLIPTLDYDYPCSGIPVAYFFDRGSDFQSAHVLRVGLAFDTRMDYAPGEHPEYKGKIERFLGTMHGKTSVNIKGAMPRIDKRSTDRRKDKSEAVMTFSDFVARLWKWVAMVYAKDFHEGIRDTPLDRWNQSADLHPPRPPWPKEYTERHLMRVEPSTVTVNGVRAFGLNWQGAVLKDIMRSPGHRKDTEVMVSIDDLDLAAAYVIHPATGEFIRLRPVQRQDMTGLSKHEHDLIRTADGIKRDGVRSEAALLRARDELRREAAATFLLPGTGPQTSSRVARMFGVGAIAPAGDDLGSIGKAVVPPPTAAQPPTPQPVEPEGDDGNFPRPTPSDAGEDADDGLDDDGGLSEVPDR